MKAKVVTRNSVNSGVTRPNLTIILQNAQKFMTFNLLKSVLRCCNPFQNASMTMKVCCQGADPEVENEGICGERGA